MSRPAPPLIGYYNEPAITRPLSYRQSVGGARPSTRHISSMVSLLFNVIFDVR